MTPMKPATRKTLDKVLFFQSYGPQVNDTYLQEIVERLAVRLQEHGHTVKVGTYETLRHDEFFTDEHRKRMQQGEIFLGLDEEGKVTTKFWVGDDGYIHGTRLVTP